MTLSKAERILAAIVTAITPTTGISSRVFRDRWEAVARSEMPCLVVEPQGESDDILTTTETLTTTLTFTVDVLISGAPLSTLADPIRVDLHARLMAASLGVPGVISLYPQARQWQAEPGEIGILSCSYAVRYRTLLSDLTA